MVAATGEVRGSQRLTESALLPRGSTHIGLLVLGLAAAQVSWWLFDEKLLAYIGGVMGPFCLLCAGAVWGMRDKLDASLDGENMPAEQYRRVVAVATRERRRFMWRAARVAVCAAAAGSPAIALQTTGAVWHWMVIAGGIAAGDAAFSYLLANHWDEQLRAFRAQQKLASKQAEEQRALAQRIEGSEAPLGASWASHSDDPWPAAPLRVVRHVPAAP